MAKKVEEFPNLLFSNRVAETLKKEKALTKAASYKIQESLKMLNDFGAKKEYLGLKNFKKFPDGWYELRIKDKTNTWRVLFRKLPETKVYGLVYLFLKQTDAITTEQWKIAEHIARLEGWI